MSLDRPFLKERAALKHNVFIYMMVSLPSDSMVSQDYFH